MDQRVNESLRDQKIIQPKESDICERQVARPALGNLHFALPQKEVTSAQQCREGDDQRHGIQPASTGEHGESSKKKKVDGNIEEALDYWVCERGTRWQVGRHQLTSSLLPRRIVAYDPKGSGLQCRDCTRFVNAFCRTPAMAPCS